MAEAWALLIETGKLVGLCWKEADSAGKLRKLGMNMVGWRNDSILHPLEWEVHLSDRYIWMGTQVYPGEDRMGIIFIF